MEETMIFKSMGTEIMLKVVCDSPNIVLSEMKQIILTNEKRFSANRVDSELMQINLFAGIKPVKVHKDLYYLIAIGKKYSLLDNSFLNIAIGAVVQAWRIGFEDARVLSSDEVNELLQITNPEDIELDRLQTSVYLKKRGMRIDLGALAKGFIADLLIQSAKNNNVDRALINLGGNIVSYVKPTESNSEFFWTIGLRNPRGNREQCLLTIASKNESVVTSGTYERTLNKKGKNFHHILNPRTGFPIYSDIESITIISNKSVLGEVFTSYLFGYTSTQAMETIDQKEGIQGIIITKDNGILYSKGLKDRLKLQKDY